MEPWQLIFISLYGTVLAYLALTSIQHDKKLAIIGTKLDHLSSQMNLFLKSEVDTLKEIANSVRKG